MKTHDLSIHVLMPLHLLLFISIACAALTGSSSSSTNQPETPAKSAHTPSPTPQTHPTSTALENPEPTTSNIPGIDVLVPPPPPDAGACANVLYPIVPGNQWVYQVITEEGEQQVGLSVTGLDDNIATMNTLNMATGITTETKVECSEGTIINYPLILLNFLFRDVEGSMQFDHVEGIFAPDHQTFEQNNWGYNWETKYTISGVIDANIEDEIIWGKLLESPLEMHWETAGAGDELFEPIEVPAGAFPKVIKIKRELTLDFTAELEEDGIKETIEATLILHNNMWFEPNMGLLKQEIEQSSIRLYGITFPIVIESTVELLEFRSEN